MSGPSLKITGAAADETHGDQEPLRAVRRGALAAGIAITAHTRTLGAIITDS